MRVAPIIVLVVVTLLGIGCRSDIDAPLAEVETVSPEIVEPGDIIRAQGRGFVEGPAQISLEGHFTSDTHKNGQLRTITLEGTAVSGQLVEFAITPKSIADIASEPTRFSGTIRISFPSPTHAKGIRVVAEKSGVAFDFRPTGTSIPQAVSRAREAHRFLKTLGITLHRSEWGGGESLVVQEVTSDSVAHRAGLEPGDRLLAVNGVALASAADLVAVTSSSVSLDIVSRNGTMRQVVLNVGLKAHLTGDELAAIVLASIALGLFLAFSAPTRRRLPTISFVWGNPFYKALSFGAISLALLMVPAAAMLAIKGHVLFLVLVCCNAFGLAVSFLNRPQPVFGRLISCVLYFAPTPIMLLWASALSSSTSVSEIVALQESAPWGINAWSSPFAVAALLLSISLSWPRNQEGMEGSVLHPFAGWIAAVPAACLLVICWFGGWWVPGIATEQMTHSAAAISLGCLTFLAKAWLVLLAIRGFASAGVRERRRRRWGSGPMSGWRAMEHRWRLFALVLIAGAGLGWFVAPLPMDLRIAGQLLATGASVSLFTAAVVLALKVVSSRPELGHNLFGDNRRDKTGDIPA